jgi:hemerythrin
MAQAFSWSETYSVHVDALDRQHQELFKTLNELNDALSSGYGEKAVDSVLKKLEFYCRSHFAAEEKMLENAGYPDLAAHRARHQEFTRRLDGLIKSHRSGQVGVAVSLMLFLSAWLREHILGVDKNYTPYLESKGVH